MSLSNKKDMYDSCKLSWHLMFFKLFVVENSTWKIQDGGFETDFLSVPLNNIIPLYFICLCPRPTYKFVLEIKYTVCRCTQYCNSCRALSIISVGLRIRVELTLIPHPRKNWIRIQPPRKIETESDREEREGEHSYTWFLTENV